MKSPGKIIVVSSPSGGGKSSIIRRVLGRLPRLRLAVSHTSRRPRPGERDGVDYHFVPREEFLRLRRGGAFVESVRLHGHYYGTSRGELEKLMSQGRDILLDIDVRGGASVRKIFPGAVTVFVLPPSLDVLEERLRRRGSESAGQIRARLETAAREVRAAKDYRYVIVNRRLARAAAELEAVITAERLRLDPPVLRALVKRARSRS